MNFIADLHIHSRFSLATSRQLNVGHLAQWAMRKGINVLGTGDFTHPAWRQELADNLVMDENSGFYRCRDGVLAENGPFFCLQAEISCIYKKAGKVRKVHNLVYAPDLECADEIARRLALIGNINSDGRPILGLDSHDLLEIILECSENCVLVPAHIWTPWFALFGSKSGFDKIEDCYGDLTSHIFALETGLSSDPPMNRCLSALDNFALISNSDAHSGPNLGREANIFAGKASYAGMFQALRHAARRDGFDGECKFLGTMEFYPEEGKYHLDGHRECNVVLDPAQSRDLGNICPVCGKPLTIGVLHRVMELADRDEPGNLPLEPEARMLVPLQEVIAQIMGAGPASRKVRQKYDDAIAALGPELDILCNISPKDVGAWWEPLGEAVTRIRSGQVILDPGYDGRYGLIKVFSPEELADIHSGRRIFLPGNPTAAPRIGSYRRKPFHASPPEATPVQKFSFSTAQLAAISAGPEPVFVAAGPGSGKTRVLTARIMRLLEEGEAPDKVLALTFTRRAAGEMRDRLAREGAQLPYCDTLHALAGKLMDECGHRHLLLSEETALGLFSKANDALSGNALREAWNRIGILREQMAGLDSPLVEYYENYRRQKRAIRDIPCLDYTDLLNWLLDHAKDYRGRWNHILVDEAQDLSALQLEIIHALSPGAGSGFFGIGDPDQAIYGFRGISGDIQSKLSGFWPNLQVLRLDHSYRACQNILDMAHDVLGDAARSCGLEARGKKNAELRLFTAENEQAEAQWIAGKVKSMLGPTSHSLADRDYQGKNLSPGDIAVLVRLKAQLPPLVKALRQAGLPCHAPGDDEFWKEDQCLAFLDYVLRHDADLPPRELVAQAKGGFDSEFLAGNAFFARLCGLWQKTGSWENFFQELAWLEEAERIREKAEAVQLLTLHSSKGLEFDTVFIPGLEAGLLPLDPNVVFVGRSAAPACADEEARLFYVGLTRAADAIYLSRAKKRMLYGRTLCLPPSPLLAAPKKYCRQSRRVRHVLPAVELLDLYGNPQQTD